MTDRRTTHFGFKTVDEAEKQGLVRQVFDSVAPRYDLMNDLMSMGVHRLWKDAFVDWLNPRPTAGGGAWTHLDVAGGTGDIAFRVADKVRARDGAPHVMVCDINAEMLRHGRDRAFDRNTPAGLDWIVGNAEDLPIEDMSVDAYTIAFGLRNVTRIDRALAEARRVLKPGGRFLCLEFSQVVLPVMAQAYDLYSFNVLPRLGGWVAGDRDSYQYLVESIRKFPPQAELAARMEAQGLSRATWRNLSGGIAAMHSGWRV